MEILASEGSRIRSNMWSHAVGLPADSSVFPGFKDGNVAVLTFQGEQVSVRRAPLGGDRIHVERHPDPTAALLE